MQGFVNSNNVDGHTEDEHLQEGGEVEEQVVVGKTGSEIVEQDRISSSYR